MSPETLSSAELTEVASKMQEEGVSLGGALTATALSGGRSNLTFRLTDRERTGSIKR
jgi:hypothetical protein